MSLKHDAFEHNARLQLKRIFDAIRELMAPPPKVEKRPIGFVTPEERPAKPKAIRKR